MSAAIKLIKAKVSNILLSIEFFIDTWLDQKLAGIQ